MSISTVHTWLGDRWFSDQVTCLLWKAQLSGEQQSSCWPQGQVKVMCASSAPSLLFFCDAERSQSWNFDDVDASRAGGGLDARRCWVAQGRPPLHGPVETVPVGAQIRGGREADDRRGEPTTFTVDPAAVVQFQVQVGTTRQTKVQRKRGKGCLWDVPSRGVTQI